MLPWPIRIGSIITSKSVIGSLQVSAVNSFSDITGALCIDSGRPTLLNFAKQRISTSVVNLIAITNVNGAEAPQSLLWSAPEESQPQPEVSLAPCLQIVSKGC